METRPADLEVTRLDEYVWQIPQRGGMRVPGVVFAAPALFEQAALALASLLCDPAAVEPRESYSVIAEAPGGSPDALLVAWLNELLYRMETDDIVLGRFTIAGLTHRYVAARAAGEPRDRRRHEPRLDVKAATYHGLSLRRGDQGWEATVVLDV